MKKNKFLLLTGCIASLLFLGACQNENQTGSTDSEQTTASSKEKIDLNSLDLPQLSTDVSAEEDLVELVTSEGNIKIKLFPKYAPKAVENFMTHAKDGYYDGLTFHRIVQNFMIQGGDPAGNGSGGESIWGEEFAPEFSPNLYHLNGALAMARTSVTDKNGKEILTAKTQSSQFYIVQNDKNVSDGLLKIDYPEQIIEAYKNGGVPRLDFEYSVFGQVIEGLDIVQKIGAVETVDNGGGEKSKPTRDITIEKINILQEHTN